MVMRYMRSTVRHRLLVALACCTVSAHLAAADRTSSPYEPATPNDHTFVRNGGPNLDVSCATFEEGPLTIQIPVSRYAGETNLDGTLKYASAAIRNGVVAPFATLTVAFRQEQFNTIPPVYAQRDLVSFNGIRVDHVNRKNSPYLAGEPMVWRDNTFLIPIERVHFPRFAGLDGATPTPENNSVTIDIDTLNADHDADNWCTKLDWVELEIRVASPIILVHGINSSGAFFDRHGFTAALRNQGFIVDNSINLGSTGIDLNAVTLGERVPKIVASFGVDSVHLVAHSKGGLDTRAYITDVQPTGEHPFTVLSLTTLATPHNGSVLADIIVGTHDEAAEGSSLEFPDFPALTGLLAGMNPFVEGYKDLKPSSCASFNRRTLQLLPRATAYFAAAGDADLNGNSRIDNSPDEYAALRIDCDPLAATYANPLRGGHFAARLAVDTLYQILRKTPGVTITTGTRVLEGASYRVAVFHATSGQVDFPNDTLVIMPSALGSGGFLSKTSQTTTLTGTAGRNHSSIADSGVASTVRSWILEIDKARGDLASEEPR